MIKLSIIVPIYNVEKYIRTCIESIFNQGLSDDNIELILVNDGTPDKSMEKIADIIKKHNNIQIINQPNQGPSIARNKGIQKATGKYLYFIDSDDKLIDNSLPYIIDKINKTEFDIIVADFFEMLNNNIDKENIVIPNNIKISEKKGDRIYIEELSPHDCHVWHTIFRKDFLIYNNISFTPHIYYEDIPFMHECYLKAKTCLRIYLPIYIYRRSNTMSITANFNKNTGMDFCKALTMVWELSNNKNLSTDIIARIKENVYISFSVLLYCITHDVKNNSERMTILKHVRELAPDMQLKKGFRQRTTDFMYRRMPYSYMNMRVFYVKRIEKPFTKIKKLYKRIKSVRKASST